MLKLRKKIPLFKTKAISRVGIHSYKTLFLIKDLSGNPGSLSSPLCCLSWIVSRRESERRNHSLARHADILAAVETRLSLLNMTFMKYVDSNLCCFIPGKVRSSASGPQDGSKTSLTDRGPFDNTSLMIMSVQQQVHVNYSFILCHDMFSSHSDYR